VGLLGYGAEERLTQPTQPTRLPGAQRDPFDRMLAAQALIEDVALVTNDPAFGAFGVKVVW
jgi:PIN domain nuclease of toxin-antitoxin system